MSILLIIFQKIVFDYNKPITGFHLHKQSADYLQWACADNKTALWHTLFVLLTYDVLVCSGTYIWLLVLMLYVPVNTFKLFWDIYPTVILG